MVVLTKNTLAGKLLELAQKLGGKIATCTTADNGKVLTPSGSTDNEYVLTTIASGIIDPTIIYSYSSPSNESPTNGSITSSVIPSTAKLLEIAVIANHYSSTDVKVETLLQSVMIPTAQITGTSSSASLITNIGASQITGYVESGVGYYIKADITGVYEDPIESTYWKVQFSRLSYW